MPKIELSDEGRDIVLAALRLWQHSAEVPVDIMEIATNGSTHAVMSDDDIDDLCEHINCD